MPQFFWQGIDVHGNMHQGVLHAQTCAEIEKSLRAHQVAMIGCSLQNSDSKKARHWIWRLCARMARQKCLGSSLQKSNFFDSLSVLLECGMDIISALQGVAQQREHRSFKQQIDKIIESLSAGEFFWMAIEPYVHDEPLVVPLLKVAQESESLPLMLHELSVYFRERAALGSALRSALIMPFFTLALAIIVAGGLCGIVVPRFEVLFNSMGQALPGSTAVIFAISAWLREWVIVLLVALIMLSMFSFYVIKHSLRVRQAIDGLLWRIPYIHCVAGFLYNALFFQALSLYLAAGISCDRALVAAANVVNNHVYRAALEAIAQRLACGSLLSESFKIQWGNRASQTIVSLLILGEQSGDLQFICERIAHVARQDFLAECKKIGRVIPPLTFLLLGVLICGILAGIYLPIFTFARLL